MEAGTSDSDGQVLEPNPLQNRMNYKMKSVQTKSNSFFKEFKHLGAVQPLSIHWLVPQKINEHVKKIREEDISKKRIRNLSQAIKEMVSIYNKQLKEGDVNLKVSQYTKDKSWKCPINENDIQILIYSSTTTFVKALSRQTQKNPKKSKKNDSLVFLIQSQPKEQVIALTTGNAWRVVLKFCNFSFPIKVTEKVGDPRKVICLEKRMIFGTSIKEKVTIRPQRSKPTPLKTTDLYYRVENLKCDLKDDSSLFQRISCLIKESNESERGSESENENQDFDENEDDNENEYKNGDEEIALSGKKRKRKRKINRIWIEVTKKGLRIGRKLKFFIYPYLFDLFANYVENMPTLNMKGTEETADPLFAFLKFFQPSRVPKKILDKKLIDRMFKLCLKGKTPGFDVRHPHCDDYLFSNLFEIKIGDKFKKFGSMPPEIGDVIELTVNKNIEEIELSDKEKFQKGLFEGQLRFQLYDCLNEKPKEFIIDCIEGHLHYQKAFHCKIGKMWYILNEEYLSALNEDFQRLLKDALIAEKSKWWLHRPWKDTETLKAEDKERMKTKDRSNGESRKEKKQEEEGIYNRSYLDEKGFIVLDTITPFAIESCDLIRYDDNSVYLYHVKKTLGQPTREACSQILNAAEMIRGAITLSQGSESSNYLERLWQCITEYNGKEEWRKVVAEQVKNLRKKSFFNLFCRKKIVFVYAYVPSSKSFSSYLTEANRPLEGGVIKKLYKAKYFNEYEQLTGKFFSETQKSFLKEMSRYGNKGVKYWKEIYSKLANQKFGNSNIAKMDLIRVSDRLQKLKFGFKICEIQKYKMQAEIAPGPSYVV